MKQQRFAVVAGTLVLIAAAAVSQVSGRAVPVTRTLAATAAAPAGTARFVIDPQASEASYRVGETFFENNRFHLAVGVTHGIQGDIYVDRVHPDQSRLGAITVNINQLTSDSARRDAAIRRHWLESDTYPAATFTPTSIEGLPKTSVAGQDIPVRIHGNLSVHGVTKPAVFTGTVRLAGNALTGTVETKVQMTDFGFDPPAIMMLKTENQATLNFRFTAHPAGV